MKAQRHNYENFKIKYPIRFYRYDLWKSMYTYFHDLLSGLSVYQKDHKLFFISCYVYVPYCLIFIWIQTYYSKGIYICGSQPLICLFWQNLENTFCCNSMISGKTQNFLECYRSLY